MPNAARKILRWSYHALLMLFVLGGVRRASAQSATALDRYEPSAAGAELGAVSDAGASEVLVPRGELRLSVAKNPLVLTTTSAEEDSQQRIVSHQVVLHGLVGITVLPRVSIDLDVPVILTQGGESSSGTFDLSAPGGASLADVRGAVSLQMVESKGAAPDVAFRLETWLPTGNDEEFASTGSTRVAPQLVAGAAGEWGAYGLNIGPRMSPTGREALLDDELLVRVGGGPRFGPVLITGEVFSTFQRERDEPHLFSRVPHIEGLLHSKIELANWFVRIGGALGLTDALGTPAYRGILGVGYAPTEGEPVRRIQPAAKSNAPVVVVEPTKDVDGDGLPDEEDQCPNRPGPLNNQGCPTDGDQDGSPDAEDSCPKVPGVAHPDAKKHGCPLDSDGDGIVDQEDACPKEVGIESEDPKTHGCPKSVRIEGEQILILQQVVFATANANIAEESNELLGEIAAIFRAHPEITRVSIEGHTDNAGRLRSNMKLSRARAMSVMRWLIAHGVEEERLQATGYGPKRPIESNHTQEGRQKNRRVEFHIIERETASDSNVEGPTDD